jgi:hypothetical protein
MVETGGGACKNSWWLARGKRFPVRLCLLLWDEMYPVGRLGPWRGKILEADGGGRAAPDPKLCRWRSGLVQGLSRCAM